jgi:YbbR domain-containing protein
VAKALSRRARRDLWILRIFAAAISVLLWATVVGGKRGEVSRSVRIEYLLPKNLIIANNVPREVTLRVTGARAFLKDFETLNLTLPVDLSNRKQGTYDLPLQEDMFNLPLGLRAVAITPNLINLRLDRSVSRRVPVRPVLNSSLPEGMLIRRVLTTPSTVEIFGSAARIQAVENLPTESIAVSGSSLEQRFEVGFNFSELGGIQVDEQDRSVSVLVQLEGVVERRWVRKIPVRVLAPAGSAGFSTERLGIKPESVSLLLEGPQAAMQALQESEIEVNARLTSLQPGTYRLRLDWGLNPEIRVVRRSSDWVEVTIPSRK